MEKRQKNRKRIAIILAVLLAAAAACFLYINDYYRALPEALSVVSDPAEGITVLEQKNERIVFAPTEASAGLIFYPGGKVQYEAYAPLMEKLAERGILCVLLHMPANLAVLDANAAEGIAEEYPEIESWYIGGHSLGGSMAASYAAEHTEGLDGIILLAAYSTAELPDDGLEVLSVYGSEDRVLNLEKYEKYRDNLPAEASEEVISGGNHAYFGTYGSQEGDGTAGITNEEQLQLTADRIAEMIFGK